MGKLWESFWMIVVLVCVVAAVVCVAGPPPAVEGRRFSEPLAGELRTLREQGDRTVDWIREDRRAILRVRDEGRAGRQVERATCAGERAVLRKTIAVLAVEVRDLRLQIGRLTPYVEPTDQRGPRPAQDPGSLPWPEDDGPVLRDRLKPLQLAPFAIGPDTLIEEAEK